MLNAQVVRVSLADVHKSALEALTRGRTDHFRKTFSQPWIFGWLLILFTVSSLSLVFSYID